MILHLVLSACTPGPLTTIPGATRLAQLANGELLVGTETGEVWFVDTFGTARARGRLDGPVIDLLADPLGRYWARTGSRSVYAGGVWLGYTQVATDAALLVQGCESTRWVTEEQADANVSAAALVDCDTTVQGFRDGSIDGTKVTGAAITRLQKIPDGLLWVDASGGSGCLGCDQRQPSVGVVDAIYLFLPPFLPGEIAWLDQEGGLWIAPV